MAGRGGRPARVERRIVGEYRVLQRPQLRPRIETEFVHEDGARILEGPEGVGLAARAVQGEHQEPVSRSRSGWSVHSVVSSAISSACLPSSRSAWIRSSNAPRRSSSNRTASRCSTPSSPTPCNAGPCHSASPADRTVDAATRSPAARCSCPCRTANSNRRESSSSSPTSRR